MGLFKGEAGSRSVFQRLPDAVPGLVVFVLLQITLLVRLLPDPGKAIFADDYLAIAQAWRDTGTYAPTFFGPGYPFLLRLILASGVGHEAAIGVAELAHLLIGGAIIVMTASLVRCLKGTRQHARFAAILLGFEPVFAIDQVLLRTEPLYTLLLLGTVVVTLRAGQFKAADDRPPAAWHAGVGTGITLGILLVALTLTRGTGLFVGVLATLYLCGCARWRVAAVAIAVTSVLLSGWAWRNEQVHGHFALSSSTDYNVAVLLVGPAKARTEGVPTAASLDIWRQELKARGVDLDQVSPDSFDVAAIAREVAIGWAEKHPMAVARQILLVPALSFIDPDEAEWSKLFGPSRLRRDLFNIGRAMLFGGACIGMVRLGIKNPIVGFLLIPVLFLHPFAAGSGSYSRFTVPVIPIVIVLSALAVSYVFPKRRYGVIAIWAFLVVAFLELGIHYAP